MNQMEVPLLRIALCLIAGIVMGDPANVALSATLKTLVVAIVAGKISKSIVLVP